MSAATHRGADALGFGDRFGAVAVGDVVLAKNDRGVYAGVFGPPEHFDGQRPSAVVPPRRGA